MSLVLAPGVIRGRLTLVHKVKKPGYVRLFWLCRCACGTELVLSAKALHGKRHNTKSCGCLKRELTSARFLKHGHTRSAYNDGNKTLDSPEYRAWSKAKSRCANPNDKAFVHYGGRGISMCERWRNDFRAFLADVGSRPSDEYSLDRINTNGHYEPGNVRWATLDQQIANRRPIRRPLHTCPNCAHQFRH